MKILIVEDEPSLREIMVQTLRREQYVVEQASDYASALEKCSAVRCHWVFPEREASHARCPVPGGCLFKFTWNSGAGVATRVVSRS